MWIRLDDRCIFTALVGVVELLVHVGLMFVILSFSKIKTKFMGATNIQGQLILEKLWLFDV